MSYFPEATRSPIAIPSGSPSTSPAGRSIRPRLGATPSSADVLSDLFNTSLSISTSNSGAQNYGSASRKPSYGAASSYLSDADLFGDDEVSYMDEAPEPPRSAEVWQQQQAVARPLLPPVSPVRPRVCRTTSSALTTKKKRRTSSGLSKASKG